MSDKAIEITMYCADLCKFEKVKNLTRLDGTEKTFIEKWAYDSILTQLKECEGKLELAKSALEFYAKNEGLCISDGVFKSADSFDNIDFHGATAREALKKIKGEP